MKEKRGTGRLGAGIIGVLAVILIISGGMTIRSYMGDKRADKEYGSLAELGRETKPAAGIAAPETAAAAPKEPETKPYASPIDFDELIRENPDTVGWIKMPGTRIDYPIVQGTDNDFYLNHDFYGKKSAGGVIYLDYESQGDFLGRNSILYGHNMKNGSMFKDLVRYKDEAFFKEHRYFTIYTPEREIQLRAVACYYGEAKPIVRKTRFKSQESFDAFVREMVKPCSFSEVLTYPAGTLYTLVTCSYEMSDARTFLYAVEADRGAGGAGAGF